MKKYVLISKSFSGHMAFYYNEAGLLVEFQVNSWDIDNEALIKFHEVLPRLAKDSELVAFVNHFNKHYRLRREGIDLSFDRLHDWFGDKRDRYIAEKKWPALKRYWVQIFQNWRCYRMYCNRNAEHGYKKMMLKTYLGERQYESDWDKVEDFK